MDCIAIQLMCPRHDQAERAGERGAERAGRRWAARRWALGSRQGRMRETRAWAETRGSQEGGRGAQ